MKRKKISKIESGLLIARALAAEGITHVSTLCGGHIAPILHACKELGIRVIDTRHDAAAVHIASGFAEVTGGTSVCQREAGVHQRRCARSRRLAAVVNP